LGKFSLDAVAGIAHPGSVRASALDHKAFDNPVEDQAVIKFFVDQTDEIVYGIGSDFRVKLRLDYVSVFHGNSYNRILCHISCPFL